ncbi:ankyrin repeat [Hyphodiscus hymeniophilus]|uniref:Ankyrin repeat n=1 Tax=Hyphodiscus hymeniophilus TaxID=353542 RepID=A0A9P7B071_9HELO|nr:ankyrin repeat [Hyphodiscus hymeniophilus]
MTSHIANAPRVREDADFSFFDALTFDGKDPAVQIHEALKLSAFPAPPKPKAAVVVPSPQSTALTRTTTASGPPKPVNKVVQFAPKMASAKAQAQCLALCHKTTSQIDRISIRILEYLTTHKHPQFGFESLAHDFLDTCQILFSLEAGLSEYGRTGQKFPMEMLTELDMKFRVTQADFRILEEMMNKMLGNSGKINRAWGKMFGDTDIKKMASALAKTRESLRMSSLVFQWSLGSEKVEREMGIGYTGLAAALDRMDHKSGVVAPKIMGGAPAAIGGGTPIVVGGGPPMAIGGGPPAVMGGPLPPTPPASQTNVFQQSPAPIEEPPSRHSQLSVHSHESVHQQQLFHQQMQMQQQQQQIQRQQSRAPQTWSDRTSSIQNEMYQMGKNSQGPNLEQFLSHDYRGNAAAVPLPTIYGTNGHQYAGRAESFDHTSLIEDTHSLAARAESETYHDDLAALDLGYLKVAHLSVDPSSMPHARPLNPVDGDTTNMKAALVAAIRNKNHKIVEQLLNRGVSANTGPSMHALKEAILAHDEEAVRLLLMFGADPNDPDREGNTPLFLAVEKLFMAGATILLKYGADPNLVAGPDLESSLAMAVIANNVGFSHLLLSYNGDIKHLTSDGNTLLIAAMKKKTPKKFIELLLEYGADPNGKSRRGETALFEALQLGRADIATSLLEHGADPNLPGPKHMLWPAVHYPACLQILLSHGADHKKAPGIMELSVSTNNMESVKILLKAGVNPNTKKDGVYTPLCTAIRDDRADLLHLLLSNGADPNTMASEYPAFKCVTHDRLHFLPTLVTAGADLHRPKGILETAVTSKNMEAMKWLLDQGVSPNDKTPKGMSPLTTAIREDRIDMVDLLLQRGADPHMRGQDWPVCMAVRNPPILRRILKVVPEPQAFKGVMEMAVHANQLESVKLLLAAGVSVEDKNGGVFSPLTTALRENRRDIVRYLLTDGGADVNAPGEHLPVVKALRRFHGEDTEMLEYLLDHGADANRVYRGWNAMMQAVENGDVAVLKLLCDRAGVDLDAKDETGKTVVEMAAFRGWDEAVQILKKGDIRLRR